MNNILFTHRSCKPVKEWEEHKHNHFTDIGRLEVKYFGESTDLEVGLGCDPGVTSLSLLLCCLE